MTGELLTLAEVCEQVHLSPWAVRRAITRGELVAFKLAGRIRISESDLSDWMSAGRIKPEQSVAEASPQALSIAPASDTFRSRLRQVA